VHTVAELQQVPEDELVSMLGKAAGGSLARLARAEDERVVRSERESKSVSVEDTFEHDIVDRSLLSASWSAMPNGYASGCVRQGCRVVR
jgi:DNA polymerase-4